MSENPDFDLENPELPTWVAERALGSGGYPYTRKLPGKQYEARLHELQKQLVQLQAHLLRTGERVMILFEGRDAAGKGGAISAYRENLNPRNTLSVALPKPSDRERSQWYFQRYVDHLPAAGETVLFDRSWYNRSGVEAVMGFAEPFEVDTFLLEAPRFEAMLVNDGIRLFKFWISIGREMQLKRFHDRRHDPLKQWKLSPIDLRALDCWDEFTEARNRTLSETDSPHAPWTVVRGNDKSRARLGIIQSVLQTMSFAGKDEAAIGEIDGKVVMSAPDFLKEKDWN